MINLLVGCPPAPATQDWPSYARLVALRSPTDADLSACADLADPQLSGDCALALAHRAGVLANKPEAYCDRVPPGLWQQECWFEAADLRSQQQRSDEAIALCARSGNFRPHCDYHIWLSEIVRALDRLEPDPKIPEVLEVGERIYARWAPRTASYWPDDMNPLTFPTPDPSFKGVLWTRLFQRFFEQRDTVFLSTCDVLAQDQRALCVGAGIYVVRRRALDQLSLGKPCPEDWGEHGVFFAPDERLMGPLRRICVEGVPRTAPGVGP